MVSLKPSGVARFVMAAFLLFWLCGWAAGEGFALWLLGNGVNALMSGTPLGSARTPLQIGPAIAAGSFLLLWLALWTLGGITAIAELLRVLWGEDRVLAEGGGLVVERRRGPFRGRQEFPRDLLRRIVLTPRGALALETPTATVELSRLGTQEEREAAMGALRSELGLSDALPDRVTATTLPKGWEEIITPEGERAVIPDRAIRRVQARVAAVLAVLLGAMTAAVVPRTIHRLDLLVPAIMLALFTAAAIWSTVWLARGRMEWRIGSGRMTLRKRFGPNARDVFEAQRLELVISRDSDSGDSYILEAVSGGTGATARREAPVMFTRYPDKNRRRIMSVIGNPNAPRELGAYLARAVGIPFEDRTTPEARAAEFEAVREQLEKSGPIGRFAARLVVNAKERKQI